ncbi:hypothetical protein CEXT_181741 [Caerostris extrusa]|uniref:Uncharacterized protein n=1 Tax=Caerostris extrusa TaxID=172846 RepID=A0AAV4YEH0_CAEEX|nr:hypothetical protein CEXT_181741 [Caerostris extrusa]
MEISGEKWEAFIIVLVASFPFLATNDQHMECFSKLKRRFYVTFNAQAFAAVTIVREMEICKADDIDFVIKVTMSTNIHKMLKMVVFKIWKTSFYNNTAITDILLMYVCRSKQFILD